MAIRNKEEMTRPRKIEIDLTGPDGNAFVLIGIARKLYKQLHKHEKEDALEMLEGMGAKATVSAEDLLIKEMMDGDYEHLLEVFEREFGDYVDLFR
jgi:hypothetical protein